MLKQHHRFFNLIFQVFDLFLIVFAWFLAFPTPFRWIHDFVPVTKGVPAYNNYAYLSFVIATLWYVVFKLSGVYRSRRTQSVLPEILTVLRASTIAFVLLAAGAYLFTAELFSRGVLLLFYGLSVLFLVIERLAFRFFLKHLRRHGFNLRNTLIVGDNEIGAAFLERLRFHPELGLVVKGVVLVSQLASIKQKEDAFATVTGLPFLGRTDDLSRILRSHDIDQIVLALKNAERDRLEEILSTLADQNVDVRIIPDLHQFITLGCDVEEFEGLPLISLNQSPIIGWNSVAKRISDIAYASTALVIFSPLMLLIAAAIRLFSPGPILHRQERMGLDGRVFRMLKFRTMRVDAEILSGGATWTTKDDKRITWVGRILRRTSLDELPQLINVLRGEMSCVGPRPEQPALVEKFRHDIPRYMLRHKVKAGMTGWAQVNGWRGNTSLEKRIEYDLYYISNWSLLFDFKIMILTLLKGFVSKNAY